MKQSANNQMNRYLCNWISEKKVFIFCMRKMESLILNYAEVRKQGKGGDELHLELWSEWKSPALQSVHEHKPQASRPSEPGWCWRTWPTVAVSARWPARSDQWRAFYQICVLRLLYLVKGGKTNLFDSLVHIRFTCWSHIFQKPQTFLNLVSENVDDIKKRLAAGATCWHPITFQRVLWQYWYWSVKCLYSSYMMTLSIQANISFVDYNIIITVTPPFNIGGYCSCSSYQFCCLA